MNEKTDGKAGSRWLHGAAAGVILILVGLAALLGRWLDTGPYLVLLLGAAMLVWGTISHTGAWFIPGGILAGIGLGILANEGLWHFPAEIQNGIFLECFALGWLLITLLSKLALRGTMWWALIPGGIMAALGAAAIMGVKNLIILVCPVAMILIGLFLFWRWGQERLR